MALPQKIIERLSREPVRTPGWSSRVLMFTGTIFFLSLAIAFGVFFGYKPYLNSQVSELANEIKKFEQKIPLKEQERLIGFYSQLYNLNQLLVNQKLASAAFPWLEDNTHVNVAYSSIGLDIKSGKIALTARAKSIDDLIQQLVFLEESPDVKEIGFNGTSIDEKNAAGFSLNLTLDPKIFTDRPGF